MTRSSGSSLVFVLLLGLLAIPGQVQTCFAQAVWPPPEFNANDLKGAWVVQVSGEVFLPPPLNGLNGPFVRTARLVLEPSGKLNIAGVVNFGGVIDRETYPGTFSVTKEGLVTIEFANVPIPTFANIPNVFTFEGYVMDKGNRIRLMLAGIKLGGQALPNLGMVLWGELTRQ